MTTLILLLTWLVPETRRAERNSCPWVVATPFLDSIGSLLYLVFASSLATED